MQAPVTVTPSITISARNEAPPTETQPPHEPTLLELKLRQLCAFYISNADQYIYQDIMCDFEKEVALWGEAHDLYELLFTRTERHQIGDRDSESTIMRLEHLANGNCIKTETELRCEYRGMLGCLHIKVHNKQEVEEFFRIQTANINYAAKQYNIQPQTVMRWLRIIENRIKNKIEELRDNLGSA